MATITSSTVHLTQYRNRFTHHHKALSSIGQGYFNFNQWIIPGTKIITGIIGGMVLNLPEVCIMDAITWRLVLKVQNRYR